MAEAAINPGRLDAVLLDLDGVLTGTAALHASAWKEAFDAFLRDRAERTGEPFRPFDAEGEYRRHVDGLPRHDGVRGFLKARGIELPEGSEDEPGTVRGIAAAKNARFLERLRRDGPEVRPGAEAFLRRAREAGLKIAVVTASRNGAEVLEASGLRPLADALVDGNVAAERDLAGKPRPDTFLEAARRLDTVPERAAVVEDAVAGVRAGREGGFGLVLGMGPEGRRAELEEAGADAVAPDLAHVRIGAADPPSALAAFDDLRARIGHRRLALFLDYDGTLTPIVDRPDLAKLSDETRAVLERLKDRVTVAVVSGRGREDLEDLVRVEGIAYAGAHGFDIRGPGGAEMGRETGGDHVAKLAEAAERLREDLADVKGVIVEDKTYAVAIHWRQVAEADVPRVDRAVQAAADRAPGLRRTGGKKIYELRPDIDWDKGRAVLWLLEALGLDGDDVVPLYIGDDETDRDAFRALKGRGLSIFVAEEPQETEADYRLADPDEVRRFLARIAEAEEEETS